MGSADLSSDDAAVVCAALERLRARPVADIDTLASVARLLTDSRVHAEVRPSGPTYRAVCEEAIKTLAAAGPIALPLLEGAATQGHTVTVPEPCYDQGMYIGDYSNRTVAVGAAAMEAIREIGRAHRGSVPWVGMTASEWSACRDARLMLRAAFERHEDPSQEHVRHFIAALCRPRLGEASGDGELLAAMDVAKRASVTKVNCDVLTAARAAARHGGTPVAHALSLALGPTIGLREALDALGALDGLDVATAAELLRGLVPFVEAAPVVRLPPSRAGPWDALLERVLSDLDADAPRLAFAEWLTARNDPRGELITIQCELARATPEDARERCDALRERETELLYAHARMWTRWPQAVSFRRGFVDSVFTTTSFGDRTLEALRDEPTLREAIISGHVGAAWLDALARSPAAHQLRRLVIRGAHFFPFELESLFGCTNLVNLRELELSSCNITMDAIDALGAFARACDVKRIVLTDNKLPPDARQRLGVDDVVL